MPSFNCHRGLWLSARQAMQGQPFPASGGSAVSCPMLTEAIRSYDVHRHEKLLHTTIKMRQNRLSISCWQRLSVGNTPRKAPRTPRNEDRRHEVCLLDGSRWLMRWCQPRQRRVLRDRNKVLLTLDWHLGRGRMPATGTLAGENPKAACCGGEKIRCGSEASCMGSGASPKRMVGCWSQTSRRQQTKEAGYTRRKEERKTEMPSRRDRERERERERE